MRKSGLYFPYTLKDFDTHLRSSEIDPTLFFRQLTELISLGSDVNDLEIQRILKPSFYSEVPMDPWIIWTRKYLRRFEKESAPSKLRVQIMNQNNPYFILRNFLVQEALEDLEKNNRSKLDLLIKALETPYEQNHNTEPFFIKRPESARNKPGSSALSCSS
jgi:uncharacterized protein YdiU (UPF0061 family)